jgi:hypothetical protein
LLVSPTKIGPLPEGFQSPVLALELAETRAEVETMFGPDGSDARESYRLRMLRGTFVDFALVCAYGLFLASTAGRLSGAGRTRLGSLAALLALSAAALDVLENLELLVIRGALGGHYDASLRKLALSTWPKWIALGSYFVLLFPALYRGNWTLRLAGVCGALGTLLALGAFFGDARALLGEPMALAIMGAIALLVVGTFPKLRAPQ